MQTMTTYKKNIQSLIKQAYLKGIEWQMSNKDIQWFKDQWSQFIVQFEGAVYKLDNPKINTIRQLCKKARETFFWSNCRQINQNKLFLDIVAIHLIHDQLQNLEKDISNKINQQQLEEKEKEKEKIQRQNKQNHKVQRKKEKQLLKTQQKIQKKKQQAQKSKKQSLRQKSEQKEKKVQNLRKNTILFKIIPLQSYSEEDKDEIRQNIQFLQSQQLQEQYDQEYQICDYQMSDLDENQSEEQELQESQESQEPQDPEEPQEPEDQEYQMSSYQMSNQEENQSKEQQF